MNPIITTTESVQGAAVTRYIDVIRTTRVVNTDLSLSDIFSGASQKFRSQLDEIFDKALLDLRLKAIALGADAIIGLHTDFEEIFGKGRTKFVVSLVGTAVQLDHPAPLSDSGDGNTVSVRTLRRQQLLIRFRRQLEQPDYAPNEAEWNDILNYSLFELTPLIYHRYLHAFEPVSNLPLPEKNLLIDNFIPFLKSMPYEEAAEVVYADLDTDPYCSSDLIAKCRLFHPQRICEILQPANKHTVISLLDADKENYTVQDLDDMRRIVHFLDNLPDTGHYEEGRGNLFGKTGTILVCERGHSSPVELGGHCTEKLDYGLGICNLNVKGITEAEIEKINQFKQKIDILTSLLTP